MNDKNTGVPTAPGLLLAAAVVLVLSGCAAYGTPYHAEKVTICHKNKKTLVLPESAVSGHIGHGDTYGPCG